LLSSTPHPNSSLLSNSTSNSFLPSSTYPPLVTKSPFLDLALPSPLAFSYSSSDLSPSFSHPFTAILFHPLIF
jgi:hypothetical protein